VVQRSALASQFTESDILPAHLALPTIAHKRDFRPDVCLNESEKLYTHVHCLQNEGGSWSAQQFRIKRFPTVRNMLRPAAFIRTT
jgi:hypothetical protein